MRRLVLLLAALLLPALPVAAATASQARVAQVDSSAYPDVTIYVSVTDAAGQTVGGLTQDDFQILEDGQPVAISDFAGGGQTAINTVLVIDRSGSMDVSGKMEGAKDAAVAFVEQMRPGDRTAIVAFDTEAVLVQPFTGDTRALTRAIRSLRPGESTALYDSLIAGVEQLDGISGRRALLLLTDGRDLLGTDSDAPASDATLDQAIDTAERAGIAVQAIGLGERGSDDRRTGIDERVLRRMANETDGEYFYAPSADQLASLYRRLAADLHQEYRLTYRSPRPFYDGTRRNIEVTVSGMPAASGQYVEKHLIQVRSAPLVGALLLLPVLLALVLPTLAFRRRTAPAPVPAGPAPGARAPGAGYVAGDVPRCEACDTPLDPPTARFCSICGASQGGGAEATVQVGSFCRECGTALRDGARFCGSCGAPSAGD
ncbi:MAG TPA: VWA domain-containing protein [Roseiflexaceae bacterium]|nr:VWA domain-containing protein [Roseiflexaceae bacterium]